MYKGQMTGSEICLCMKQFAIQLTGLIAYTRVAANSLVAKGSHILLLLPTSI